jgi:hypothetical protein
VVIPDETIAAHNNSDGVQREPTPSTRRADAYAFSALMVIVGVAVAFRWYYDNWLSDFDILTAFLPWFGYVGDRVADLDVPAWSRFDSSGSPMAASPSGGWMYLPVMFAFAVFEILTAFKVMVLIQAAIAATAMYAFARKIGLLPIASLAAGIAFAVGPSLYSASVYLPVAGQVMTFLAVGMLAAEMTLRTRRVSAVLGWSMLGALAVSQVFVAWPGQGFMYAAIYIGGWLLYRSLYAHVPGLSGIKDHFWRSAQFAFVVGIGSFGFAAASILPQLEFIRQSNVAGGDYSDLRGGDYVAHTWSFPELYQGQFQDVFLNRPYAMSVGVVILALLAVFRGRNRFGIPYFALMTLVFMDLASNLSLTRWLFYLVPFVESLHGHRPTGSIALLSFGPAVLAGAAVHLLVSSRNRWSRWYLALGVVPLLMLVGNLLDRDRLFVGWSPVVIGFLGVAAIALVIASTRRSTDSVSGPAYQLGVLALLVVILAYPTGIDLTRTTLDSEAAPDWTNLITEDAQVENMVEMSMARSDPGGAGELLKYAQSVETPFRYASWLGDDNPEGDYLPSSERRLDIYVFAALANGRATRLGLEQVSGYNPVHLEAYVEYVEAMNDMPQDYHWLDLFTPAVSGTQLLDMLNVRYVLIPTNIVSPPAVAISGEEVFRNQYVIVYKNPAAFERAWVVYDVRPNNDGEGLQQLAAGQADGHVTAFVDGRIPDLTPENAQPAKYSLVFEDRAQEELKFKVNSTQPGLAVVSQSYEEGWVAYVDGTKTEVLRTNHALMGVPIPAGEHLVDLRYEPQSLRIGLWSTALTSIAMIGVWCWAGLDRLGRRRREVGS